MRTLRKTPLTGDRRLWRRAINIVVWLLVGAATLLLTVLPWGI
jgi:hypothetical protein